MAQKFCTHCGAPLVEGKKFCTKCGAPLNPFYNSDSSNDSTKNKETIISIFKLVLKISLFVLIFGVLGLSITNFILTFTTNFTYWVEDNQAMNLYEGTKYAPQFIPLIIGFIADLVVAIVFSIIKLIKKDKGIAGIILSGVGLGLALGLVIGTQSLYRENNEVYMYPYLVILIIEGSFYCALFLIYSALFFFKKEKTLTLKISIPIGSLVLSTALIFSIISGTTLGGKSRIHIEGEAQFVLNGDGNSYSIRAIRYDESDTYTVPNSHNGLPVTKLKSGALSDCKASTILLPDSIIEIESNALDLNKNVKNFTIGTNVKKIGKGAFSSYGHNTSLEKLTIHTNFSEFDNLNSESNESILQYLGIGNLKEIEILEGSTKIQKKAFYQENKLKTVKLPSTITDIGEAAFYYCSSLTSINIPYGITTIKKGTFMYCYDLEFLSIPDTVTTIEARPFTGFGGEVVFPANLTYIGEDCFSTFPCKLYYKGNKIQWDAIEKHSSNYALNSTYVQKYFYTETAPLDNTYSYWHYVDNKPTAW